MLMVRDETARILDGLNLADEVDLGEPMDPAVLDRARKRRSNNDPEQRPAAGAVADAIEPRWARTTWRARLRPTPVPSALVVKKGRKMSCRSVSGTPGPLSATSICAPPARGAGEGQPDVRRLGMGAWRLRRAFGAG